MTVISFVSAKGSPGVSTAVMGLAARWPRPVVVADLDPIGGDVAIRERDVDDNALDEQRGLVSLGAAVRAGDEVDLVDHLQETSHGVEVLVGASGPRQAQSLGPAWPHLQRTLRAHDGDVLADAGRFIAGSPAGPVVEGSDAVVFLVRSEIAAVAHLRDRLSTVREPWALGRPGSTPVGVAVVGDPRDHRAVDDIGRLLAASELNVTMLGTIAFDLKGVARGPASPSRAALRSLFSRSLVDLVPRVRALAVPDPRRAGDLMDQQLLRTLREEVADALARQRREDAAAGLPQMSSEDERQFARAIIARVLESYARQEIAAGRTPLSGAEEAELADGIHAALYGVGRLQPLLDDPEVENIDINGYDNVFVGYANGEERRMPPVAESDDELVELVQVLGAYSGLTSRPFDTANPQLDLRLPDGSRLSAVMGVTPRPSLSIRRARLARVSLDMLVESGTMTPELASFLSAAIAARKNIMIAGATNAGKTTLLRALAERDLAAGAPHHRRARTRARPGGVPRPAPERRRVRGAAAELRGPGRDPHVRAGAPLAAHEPQPRHRRRGAGRRDRHDAQRDEPGQRRLAVDDPRELLARGVQPHLHLRDPVGRAAARGRHDDADRRRDRLRDLRRAPQRVPERRRPAPRHHLGP